jgi:ABC-type antimicrobial peptide transport system permease subunit
MLLLTVFGGVAIALAVTGLYGLVAYAVVQHTREVALRLALGASVQSVVGRFVGEGFAVTAAGIAFGLVAAAAVTGLLRSLIVGVTPLDPLTFVSVGALVLAIACAASALPARRAARTNPAAALRGE